MKYIIFPLLLLLLSCGDISRPDCNDFDYSKLDSIISLAVHHDTSICDTSDMFFHFMETYKKEVDVYWSGVANNAINKMLFTKDSVNIVLNELWNEYYTTVDSFGRVHFFNNTVIQGKEGMSAVAKFDSTGKPVLIIQ